MVDLFKVTADFIDLDSNISINVYDSTLNGVLLVGLGSLLFNLFAEAIDLAIVDDMGTVLLIVRVL